MGWGPRLALPFFFALAVLPGPLQAQPTPEEATGSDAPATPPQTRKAVELFNQGNRLRAAGDCERALLFFLDSRALVPSGPNTLNAAYCSYEIGRHDEALGLYEALLVDHAGELSDDQRSRVGRRVQQLLKRVGRLSIHTSEPASIVIDGRARGDSAGAHPLPLLPGTHRIRLVRPGYRQVERSVNVVAGKSQTLSVTLEPLDARGVVRIDSRQARGAIVLVDGARVGQVPWESALAPGDHVLALELGDRGTGPQVLTVVEGQVAVFEAELRPLGPRMTLVVEPAQSLVILDGVQLPGHTWTGRLPVGEHRISASASGYFSTQQTIAISTDEPHAVDLRLEVDRAHPRWAIPPTAELRLGAMLSYAVGSGLGSHAESCEGEVCPDSSNATGGALGLRFEYEFPSHLVLAAVAGYARGSVSSKRSSRVEFGVPAQSAEYRLHDDIVLGGPLVAAGIGYRLPLSPRFDLLGWGFVGALFADVTQSSSAQISDGVDTAPAVVEGTGQAVEDTVVVLQPGIEFGATLGPMRLAAGVGLLWAPTSGPQNEQGDTSPGVRSGVDCSTLTGTLPVDCAINSGVTRVEKSHGSFLLFTPNVTLSAAF